MGEGCIWHKERLRHHNWFVPPFKLTEIDEQPLATRPVEGVELMPKHNIGIGQWVLQEREEGSTSSSSRAALTAISHNDAQEATKLENAITGSLNKYFDDEFSDASD